MIAASNVAVFSRPALKRATRSRSQAVRASGNQVNAVTSITTTSTLTEQEKSLSKVDIKARGPPGGSESVSFCHALEAVRPGLPLRSTPPGSPGTSVRLV